MAQRIGVERVDYAPFVKDFRGYYDPQNRHILLCTHDVRTLFHELAHAAHDVTEELEGGRVARDEIVAETVAAPPA